MIEGRIGFADFINGYYDLEIGVLNDQHPVYKHTLPIAAPGTNGRHLYLYYHGQNQAWVVSQTLGSNGIIAYTPVSAPDAGKLKDATWHVANAYGEFVADPKLSCRTQCCVVFSHGCLKFSCF